MTLSLKKIYKHVTCKLPVFKLRSFYSFNKFVFLGSEKQKKIDSDSDNDCDKEIDEESNAQIIHEIDTVEIVKSICKSFRGVKRHECAAHAMQLVIKDALKEEEIQNLIKKASYFYIVLQKASEKWVYSRDRNFFQTPRV